MAGHDYKNYAHLEGIIEEDPVVSKVQGGVTLSFKLLVKESGPGGRMVNDLFNIEVGKDYSKFAVSLKKDTPVWIDAKIKTRRDLNHGCDSYSLYAHRIYAIDYIPSATVPASAENGHNYKNHVHLEGIIDEEPVFSKTDGKGRLSFKLSVKESKHGSDGKVEKEISVFNVEIGGEISLKKNTPVWIDGKIEIRRKDGCDAYVLLAHRLNAINFSAGKRHGGLGPPSL